MPTNSRLSHDLDVRRAFARDVSGLELVPEVVARPQDEMELAELLRDASATRTPVTPAGAQSSTTGASIVDHGMLLCTRSLDRILDLDVKARRIRVQAGALVADVRRAAEAEGLLFTPDPTSEEECTVGGAVACNASGARSLRYGATGAHTEALTVLLANGESHHVRRSHLEKNTVGYPLAQQPVDWFVGSEGTLGIVVDAEFALHPLPAQVLGLSLPFPSESQALAFVVAARENNAVHARCLEYFDAQAFDIARIADNSTTWSLTDRALVYVEETGAHEWDDAELPLDAWLAMAETHGATVNEIRVYDTPSALQSARHFRHAVPATMNERGAAYRAAGGRKVSTDWAVPYPLLHDVIQRARARAVAHDIAQAVTYGHAGNGHPHQNFLARDANELHRIEHVIEETLRDVLAVGGTVAAEHGIGKLKRRWLPLQVSDLQLRVMRNLKHELDPLGLLAPGNVL